MHLYSTVDYTAFVLYYRIVMPYHKVTSLFHCSETLDIDRRIAVSGPERASAIACFECNT